MDIGRNCTCSLSKSHQHQDLLLLDTAALDLPLHQEFWYLDLQGNESVLFVANAAGHVGATVASH